MIKSFEGLRGVAALGVALTHLEFSSVPVDSMRYLYSWTAYLLVDLFFVLSGFVIGHTYESKLDSVSNLGNFVVRRTGRLYPLFVFSTITFVALGNLSQLIKAVLVHAGYGGYFHETIINYPIPSIGELLSAATLTHSLGFFDHLILNFPSWSISTEYYTYLIFGVCVVFLSPTSRSPMYVLLIIISAVVTVAGSLGQHCLSTSECMYLTSDLGIFRCLAEFLLGVFAAKCSQKPEISTIARSSVVQTTGLMGFIAILVLSRQLPWLAFLTPLVLFMLILSVSADTGWVARLFALRLPTYLGKISYSIYLMHAPTMIVFSYLIRAVHGRAQMLIVAGAFVATVIAVSHLTFRYIEDPFRARANALADRLFLKHTKVP
ncbi:MAG TPA: acyltransferase [Acidobacteriota bacterium]|nr:acyltransferase [Acidobacteriota bacterium]